MSDEMCVRRRNKLRRPRPVTARTVWSCSTRHGTSRRHCGQRCRDCTPSLSTEPL